MTSSLRRHRRGRAEHQTAEHDGKRSPNAFEIVASCPPRISRRIGRAGSGREATLAIWATSSTRPRVFRSVFFRTNDGSLGADLRWQHAPFAGGRLVAACGLSLALPSPTEGRMRHYLALISLGAAAVAGLSGSWTGGLAAPKAGPVLADRSPSAIAVDTELVIAVDVSYSMDPDEQALQREGYITGLTSREFMHALRGGHAWQGGRDLFRMGRPLRPEDRRAVAADRRPGSGGRLRQRDRARALPAGLPHLDFERADLRQAAVRRLGLSRHPPRRRCLGRRRQQQRRSGHAGAR